MALLARDLMQPPLTLQPEMPVLEIAHLFSATQVSGAPVVDDAGAVTGMVSALDLLTQAQVIGAIDLTHAAATQQAEYAIPAFQNLARLESPMIDGAGGGQPAGRGRGGM